MVTVGITGGIGSGKSTVCKFWTEMGGYVLNADDLAKELMVSDEDIRMQLVETFGERTFDEKGALNRAYLANEAFQKGRVQELNAIVHPKLPAVVKQRMKSAARKGFKVGIYEAALLLESKNINFFDHLVLVLADGDRRLQWVRERDNTDPRDVKNRMNKQRNFEKVTSRFDVVIRNEGTLEDLKKKSEIVYKSFLHS